MSESSLTHDKSFHIKLALWIIFILFAVFVFAFFYDDADTQSKVMAWFEIPLRNADMGDAFILLLLHAVLSRSK